MFLDCTRKAAHSAKSCAYLAGLVLAVGSVCGAGAADRWQSLTQDVEFDTETLRTGKSDDKDKETTVSGWVRFPLDDPKYRSIMLDVRAYCESRSLAYSSGAFVNLDGTHHSEPASGTLAITPGSRNESILTSMCKRAKPWWKPF